MSAPRRGRQSADPLGRGVLIVLGAGLATLGAVLLVGTFDRTSELVGVAVITLGTVVVILGSVHPRLRSFNIFNRIDVKLQPVDEHSGEASSHQLSRPPPQAEERPPSLAEISRAAQNPDTDRRRER